MRDLLRNTRPVALVIAVLCGGIGAAAAASSSTVTKDPQAVGVLLRAFTALGGTQALTLTDCQAIGSVIRAEANAMPMPVVLKSKGTHLTRTELSTPKGLNIRILNEGQAVIVRGSGKVQKLSPNNTAGERVNYIPALSILSEFQNGNVKVEYLGTATVNNSLVDQVALSVAHGNTPSAQKFFQKITRTVLSVDRNSSLVTEVEYSNFSEQSVDDIQRVMVIFSNYQEISGVMVPFLQTTYVNGTKLFETILSSVACNIGLPDSDFTLPQ